MFLSKYLTAHNMTYAEFAKACGLSRITIYKILRGTDMYLTSARRIVDYTDGEVTYEDLDYERQVVNGLEKPSSQHGDQKHKKKSNKAKNK